MVDLLALIDDLDEEHAALDSLLAGLPDDSWGVVTPAEPWTVGDQISHLAFFDEQAALAAGSPDEFLAGLATVTDADEFMNGPLRKGREMVPGSLLEWWRSARARMLEGFRELDANGRIPWFGPPMSPASFISARLMETWAHGQDIVDALDLARASTARLRHVAHIGVRARPFAYSANGLEVPQEEVSVILVAPDGDTWSWNEGADARIEGDALDFCLLVTQRRHLNDTGLAISGELAEEWAGIAQAFAGPPGDGRRPGQFAR